MEGVGLFPFPVEMQALLVRKSQYNLRSSKEAFGQSPKSGSTAQENNLETRTAAQEGSGNGGHILLKLDKSLQGLLFWRARWKRERNSMRIFSHNRQLLLSLGNPLDCDEVHRATEHVKASATGKDEVLPKSRTANGNALRVCEIHRYHV